MPKNVHTEPDTGGWSVREEGAKSAGTFRDQREAVERGREMAKRNGSEHVIHGSDGRVRQSDSYSPDPFPPLEEGDNGDR